MQYQSHAVQSKYLTGSKMDACRVVWPTPCYWSCALTFFNFFPESAKSILELEEEGLSMSEIEDLQQLQRFLLSVTAKDVSLLITFRQVRCQLIRGYSLLIINNMRWGGAIGWGVGGHYGLNSKLRQRVLIFSTNAPKV